MWLETKSNTQVQVQAQPAQAPQRDPRLSIQHGARSQTQFLGARKSPPCSLAHLEPLLVKAKALDFVEINSSSGGKNIVRGNPDNILLTWVVCFKESLRGNKRACKDRVALLVISVTRTASHSRRTRHHQQKAKSRNVAARTAYTSNRRAPDAPVQSRPGQPQLLFALEQTPMAWRIQCTCESIC